MRPQYARFYVGLHYFKLPCIRVQDLCLYCIIVNCLKIIFICVFGPVKILLYRDKEFTDNTDTWTSVSCIVYTSPGKNLALR